MTEMAKVAASPSLFDCLLTKSKTQPHQIALVTGFQSISYLELVKLVISQAVSLSEKGVDNSSTLGVCCADEVAHLILVLSASYIGASSCTIPSYESTDSQKELAERCGVTHLVTYADFISSDKRVPSQDSANTKLCNEARLLFSTSGTTGKPKIVVHLDSGIVQQAPRHISSPSERFACLASMEHNFAKRHRLYCLAMGATNVFIDSSEDVVHQCLNSKVNVLHLSVFQAQQLLGHKDVGLLKGLRIKLGGSHASTELRNQICGLGMSLQAGYGTTETGAIGFTDPNDSGAAESIGKPLPGIMLRVVDSSGQELNQGERGEIAIACDGMFYGYLGQPELTDTRLNEGWFYTGDIGYVDAQNRIHLCGRVDDMFVFNSINIYPQEIESVLSDYDDISEVSVIPKDSPVHGQVPVALVVFKRQARRNVRKLKKYSDRRLGVRSPRQFVVLNEMPKNPSGKFARLRALEIPKKEDDIRAEIIDVITNDDFGLGISQNLVAKFLAGKADIQFSKVSIDSLMLVSLLVMIETQFDVVVTPQQIDKISSLNALVSLVLTGNNSERIKYDHVSSSESLPSDYSSSKVYKLFHRVCDVSKTVVQMNKALSSFENRLSPLGMERLFVCHANDSLLPKGISEPMRAAIDDWFYQIRNLMFVQSNNHIEGYKRVRLAPAATLFRGEGESSAKTLMIFFTGSGTRRFVLPTPVLLQYINSKRFDVLLISEPSGRGYEYGVPGLGKNDNKVIEWIEGHPRLNIKSYRSIRSVGCSGGAYIAALAAYRLQVEVCVSFGGRFHKERYPLKIVKRLFKLLKGVRRNGQVKVVLAYSAGNSRDRIYAKLLALLSAGSLFAIEAEQGKFEHTILGEMMELGQLSHFFKHTLFIEAQQPDISSKSVMQFPAGEIQIIN